MINTVTSLDTIVQDYLNDSEYQEARKVTIQQRDESIPKYKDIVEQFITGNLSLEAFEMSYRYSTRISFGQLKATGFLLEFNKLASNHFPSNPGIEPNMRFILNKLNAQNIGQRIVNSII